MRIKLATLGFVFILLAAAVSADETPADAPAPQAVFVQSNWKFEPVIEGSEVIHDFIVKNQGQGPLNILGVKTT